MLMNVTDVDIWTRFNILILGIFFKYVSRKLRESERLHAKKSCKKIEIDNGIRFLNNYGIFVNFFMNKKKV